MSKRGWIIGIIVAVVIVALFVTVFVIKSQAGNGSKFGQGRYNGANPAYQRQNSSQNFPQTQIGNPSGSASSGDALYNPSTSLQDDSPAISNQDVPVAQ